jgi:hypothetical protein
MPWTTTLAGVFARDESIFLSCIHGVLQLPLLLFRGAPFDCDSVLEGLCMVLKSIR